MCVKGIYISLDTHMHICICSQYLCIHNYTITQKDGAKAGLRWWGSSPKSFTTRRGWPSFWSPCIPGPNSPGHFCCMGDCMHENEKKSKLLGISGNHYVEKRGWKPWGLTDRWLCRVPGVRGFWLGENLRGYLSGSVLDDSLSSSYWTPNNLIWLLTI
jgi:hypothetical protein